MVKKNYYSDPIFMAFDYVYLDHSSFVPGGTRGATTDVSFNSWVSHMIRVPDSSFGVVGLRSHVK